MLQGNAEVLVLVRVLGTADETGARHGGAGDANGDVGVAAFVLAVVVVLAVVAGE